MIPPVENSARPSTAAAPGRAGALLLVAFLGVATGSRDGCEDDRAQELTGAEMFLEYCSPCHGERGLGNGPLAFLLNPRPPDLTVLARDGRFDEERLAAVIDGRHVAPRHGPRQMPVWGVIFEEQLRGRADHEAEARLRTQSLVKYLRSLQRPVESQPGPAGEERNTARAST